MEQSSYLTYINNFKKTVFRLNTIDATYHLIDNVIGLYNEAKFDREVDPTYLLDVLYPTLKKTLYLANRHITWLNNKREWNKK